MEKKRQKRFSKELKAIIINSIVNGELWLEEAMKRYGIEDRRQVIGWLRKYIKARTKI